MENRNNDIYAKEADIFYRAKYWRPDEEYLTNKYFQPGKKLLVLGVGAGRTLKPLYKKGYRITAIDIVPEMVAAAKKRIGNLPIKIIQMDATDLKFSDKSFDYIFFPFHGIDCIYPDIYKCIKETQRVLRDDGIFIFNSHNKYYLKNLKKFFAGKYLQDKNGLILYRTGLRDFFKLKRYFKKVKIKQRISLLPWSKANWKDMCYKLLPFLNKSTYFICKEPKRK